MERTTTGRNIKIKLKYTDEGSHIHVCKHCNSFTILQSEMKSGTCNKCGKQTIPISRETISNIVVVIISNILQSYIDAISRLGAFSLLKYTILYDIKSSISPLVRTNNIKIKINMPYSRGFKRLKQEIYALIGKYPFSVFDTDVYIEDNEIKYQFIKLDNNWVLNIK